MVVQAMVQLAIAGPVGILFGLGYGTAIRVGYEIIFPSLFPSTKGGKTPSGISGSSGLSAGNDATLKAMEKLFTNIGGLEAHKFGVNQGIKNALKSIEADPELVELIKKNSNLGSQTITVQLSGTSSQGGDQSQSSLSRGGGRFSGGPSGETLRTALAEAKRLKQIQAYTDLIEQIGLTNADIFALVRSGTITKLTGGVNVVIEFGLLTLETQRKYGLIHNQFNEAAREKARAQGPQTDTGGLLAGTQPIIGRGRKGGRPAGQSQRLEKIKLIGEIRQLKSNINVINRMSESQRSAFAPTLVIRKKQLQFARQKLADLLFRYKF